VATAEVLNGASEVNQLNRIKLAISTAQLRQAASPPR
jgi:predicted nucleotide-binding protein (sugar kinase/HSP70/actin superfamily)